jgi:hypothetical protein
MIIKPEDMLDTTELELDDVAKAFATKKVKDLVDDDDEFVDEDEVIEDDESKDSDEDLDDEIEEDVDDADDEEDDEEDEIEEDIDNEEDDEDDEDEEKEDPELDDEKATQAQLSAFAAMKRQKKEAEKKAQEMEEAFKNLNSEFAKLAKESGFEDIGSAEDYLRTLRNQRRTSEYKKTNDPSIIAEMVADSLNQRQKQAVENRQQSVDNDTPTDTAEDLIGMILEFNAEYNQNIRSIDDIASLPNAEKVIDLMGATYKDSEGNTRSLSLKDAYMIANKDSLGTTAKKTKKIDDKAAKQRALNEVKSHSHMKTTKKGGSVEKIKVKRSELNKWKEMFPEKSTKQAMKEIKMYKKNGHEI